MAKVTQQDIMKINQIYFKCKNKAQTARETGFSASTVTKYINPNFNPNLTVIKEVIFNPPNLELFKQKDWSLMLELSEDEKIEIEKLRKEVLI